MGTQSHVVASLPNFSDLLLSIGTPSVHPLSLPSDSSSGATSDIRTIAQGHDKRPKIVHTQGESYKHATIDMLSDDVLLEIFDFYRKDSDSFSRNVWEWHLLVHVCHRWRQIVYASPHRLNLEIECKYGTPVRKYLGIWPAFPIIINYHELSSFSEPDFESGIPSDDEDNAIAALEHPDRVCYLRLYLIGSQLDTMATLMQEPFPLLKILEIRSSGGSTLVLPAEFLGGSAPSLQDIILSAIHYPALPTLLLSTSDLVQLRLLKIPRTGYISPEVMVTCLAALPRLEFLAIHFQSATSRPDQMHPPPVARTVLPSLTYFGFQGASEYLEDLVAQIDSPQLNQISVKFLNQMVNFQVAQLPTFIDRSVGPKYTPFRDARVAFFSDKVYFSMLHPNRPNPDNPPSRTTILCEGIDWQVSHMAQVLSRFKFSATLSDVVHLGLMAYRNEVKGTDDLTDDVEWLNLLHQFSTVQTLHVSRDIAEHVALALEGAMVADVLPSLNLICLVGQPASSIEKFIAVRQLSGRPVTLFDTEIDNTETDSKTLRAFYRRRGSYVSE